MYCCWGPVLLQCSSVSASIPLCPPLSLCVCLCPSVSASVSLCPPLSLCVPVHPSCSSVSLSVPLCPSLSPCLPPSLCARLCPSVLLCPSLSACVPLCRPVSLSAQLCPSLFLCVCICPPVPPCVPLLLTTKIFIALSSGSTTRSGSETSAFLSQRQQIQRTPEHPIGLHRHLIPPDTFTQVDTHPSGQTGENRGVLLNFEPQTADVRPDSGEGGETHRCTAVPDGDARRGCPQSSCSSMVVPEADLGLSWRGDKQGKRTISALTNTTQCFIDFHSCASGSGEAQ